ncbi:MAG TPA: hypothetical protein VJK03_04530 [Candidatus Nanoarchaeia archaeon]|nr:hypothetical protein [Candidatus Nanoarchaeia archaeon]
MDFIPLEESFKGKKVNVEVQLIGSKYTAFYEGTYSHLEQFGAGMLVLRDASYFTPSIVEWKTPEGNSSKIKSSVLALQMKDIVSICLDEDKH